MTGRAVVRPPAAAADDAWHADEGRAEHCAGDSIADYGLFRICLFCIISLVTTQRLSGLSGPPADRRPLRVHRIIDFNLFAVMYVSERYGTFLLCHIPPPNTKKKTFTTETKILQPKRSPNQLPLYVLDTIFVPQFCFYIFDYYLLAERERTH